MIDELGFTLAELARCTPGGILVFFPSFRLMDKVYSRWK